MIGGRYVQICVLRRVRSYERDSDKIGGPPHYLVDCDDGDGDHFDSVEVREPPTEHSTKIFTLDGATHVSYHGELGNLRFSHVRRECSKCELTRFLVFQPINAEGGPGPICEQCLLYLGWSLPRRIR